MSARDAAVVSQRRRYPAYRDSGVEWLGEIPAHWGAPRLKEIAGINPEVLGEGTPSDYEIAYIDIGSVNNRGEIAHKDRFTFDKAPSRARRPVRDGDVIVSTVRTYLRAIASITSPEPNLVVSTGFAVLRPGAELDSRFAGYALRAPFFVERVVAHSVGVSYPAINESEMATFRIALPPNQEQRRIATFLDRETAKLDSLIAKKERLLELLDERRRALITRAVTKGLDPNVPMKDSAVEWLGEIPSHWALKHLAVVSRSLQTGPFGTQLGVPDYVSGGVPVINPANLRRGVIQPDFDRAVSAQTATCLARHKLEEGDIVMARRGELGRCALVSATEIGWLCGTGSLRVRLDLGIVVPAFILSVLTGAGVRDWLTLQSVGSTMDNLNTSIIGRVVVPVPPLPEQRKIGSVVATESAKLDRLTATIDTATGQILAFRTALISAAVTGKIDVREEVA